jgi:hypothetical protein
MKQWYCPACGRKGEKKDNVIVVLCRCGNYMVPEIKCLVSERRLIKSTK